MPHVDFENYLKPILHYAFVLRFCEKNANGLRF